MTQLINAGNVRLSEKEHFVLEAQSHVLQAVVALEAYKIKENLGCYDGVLSLSCELLKAHIDNFTDFALTLGKNTQGITQFRTNVQAMTDGSKLLTSGSPTQISKCNLIASKWNKVSNKTTKKYPKQMSF